MNTDVLPVLLAFTRNPKHINITVLLFYTILPIRSGYLRKKKLEPRTVMTLGEKNTAELFRKAAYIRLQYFFRIGVHIASADRAVVLPV